MNKNPTTLDKVIDLSMLNVNDKKVTPVWNPILDSLNNLNNSFLSCVFPRKLKLADVSPVYKKGERTDKGNFRPVSILPAVSKVYESLLFRQINDFIDFNVDYV